ncbi:hypothetical protein ABK040_008270 [Willaertia magna]
MDKDTSNNKNKNSTQLLLETTTNNSDDGDSNPKKRKENPLATSTSELDTKRLKEIEPESEIENLIIASPSSFLPTSPSILPNNTAINTSESTTITKPSQQQILDNNEEEFIDDYIQTDNHQLNYHLDGDEDNRVINLITKNASILRNNNNSTPSESTISSILRSSLGNVTSSNSNSNNNSTNTNNNSTAPATTTNSSSTNSNLILEELLLAMWHKQQSQTQEIRDLKLMITDLMRLLKNKKK